MIETDRIMEILDRFHVAKDSNVIGAMHQAAGEAVREYEAKYAECMVDTHSYTIALDCEYCKDKQRIQNIKDYQREIRTLLHVKGWDE